MTTHLDPCNWGEVFASLSPGSYVLGWTASSLMARKAGFHVRDSLLILTPSGPRVVWLLRKPLEEATIALQVLKTGTGALSIDRCRIPHQGAADLEKHQKMVEGIRAHGGKMAGSWKNSSDLSGASPVSAEGRWPANLILVHGPACKDPGGCALDCPSHLLGLQTGIRPGMSGGGCHKPTYGGGLFGAIDCPHTARNDTGTASRFFFQADTLNAVACYLTALVSSGLPPQGCF